MMKRLPQLIIFLFVFLLVSMSSDAHLKSLFIFGDSLFDPGNNHFVKNCTLQADFPPYGSTFFHRPTGRFTNGRTVADFIAQFMRIELLKAYREVHKELENDDSKDIPANGINFASAGSGVLPDTNKFMGVTPIQVQLKQFKDLIDQKHIHKKQIAKSLFLLEAGSNDIFTYFLLPEARNLPPIGYVNTMLEEVACFLDEIYKLGARRVAIFSVGPMGCIPARVLLQDASVDKCFGRLNAMVKLYNLGLEHLAYSTPIKHPGAVGVYGSVYTISIKLRVHADFYGYANVTEACCGSGPLNGVSQCGQEGFKLCPNPKEYFFWDYFHPTERTYGLVSKALWAGKMFQIRPMNLKALAKYRPMGSKNLTLSYSYP